jgi:hypothetical protein
LRVGWAGERDRHGDERERDQRRRGVPAPAWAARRDRPEELGAREAAGEDPPAVLDGEVGDDESGDRGQNEETAGREEGHRSHPVDRGPVVMPGPWTIYL